MWIISPQEAHMIAIFGNLFIMAVTIGLMVATVNLRRG